MSAKRSDISDDMVLAAATAFINGGPGTLHLLVEWTGAPEKVCYRAIERAVENGVVDFGVSPAFAFPVHPKESE